MHFLGLGITIIYVSDILTVRSNRCITDVLGSINLSKKTVQGSVSIVKQHFHGRQKTKGTLEFIMH